MANVIFVANTVITVLLTWMALNHLQIVDYDPIDMTVSAFQRAVYYHHLDGSVMAPPEASMTVVSFCSILGASTLFCSPLGMSWIIIICL